MPSLAQRNSLFNDASLNFSSSSASFDGSVLCNGFWSQNRCDVSYNQLQKFWCELSPQSRQELLRVDKQSLFEQARKNMYCSRCNGLLLESFLQIIMYGKSSENEGLDAHSPENARGGLRLDESVSFEPDCCQCESHDPSIHPWGGLTMTKDGALTLLDCYIDSDSLSGIQNIFDSARAREREREMLYPDACGGGSRGWISQGLSTYGRGHGTRETCALHSARLSCDTLVDFWSALGEETRQSLLRMKEEDFIERLVYRFDSKRFCRDCRRNVIREFKELKELKRIRKEPRCTTWFCAADTDFQYEVSEDAVRADWSQKFSETIRSYHHFEWAIGTAQGKSDILEFENVGMNGNVYADGLDLQGLGSCCITIKAWKADGRCTEHSVKAHALKGRQCVHCRLVVGDGFITITRGDNIRCFFEHAEEAEEEEDDESIDDGNDLDGECSRPQKHAKSPELAREFLLDAATVIFKEQVEKAFREGTARQNAHSIFITLALKLLEERIHVACKEIITLEKQMKLLEEEEKEKREEEERKERRRVKEREKKLRRKERLRQRENAGEKMPLPDQAIENTQSSPENAIGTKPVDLVSDTDDTTPSTQNSPETESEQSNVRVDSVTQNLTENSSPKGEPANVSDSFTLEHSKHSCREKKSMSGWHETRRLTGIPEGKTGPRQNNETTSWVVKGLHRQTRINPPRSKFQSCSSRVHNKYRSYYCSCSLSTEYKVRDELHVTPMSNPRQMYRSPNQVGKPRSKFLANKKVWERMDTEKKCPRSSSDSDFTSRTPERTSPMHKPSESDAKEEEDSFSKGHPLRTSSSAIIGSNTSRTSSSDNCSSEGESNAACSSPSNTDLFSTSDSDDTRQSPEKEAVSASETKPDDVQHGIYDAESHVTQHAETPPQGLPFPVFHPPLGFYPPPSTLIPFAHPYQYLFTNPIGYGLSGVPYQAPPPVQVSDKVSKSARECQPREKLSNGGKDLSNGFSLFHFGGPAALSSAVKSGCAEVGLSNTLDCGGGGDICCGKKTAVEEYNLFAASNGLRFPFF